MRTAAVVALAVLAAAPARAQTPAPSASDRKPLGNRLTADVLADLPAGVSLYTLLDSAMPEVIGDRIDTGGLTTGETGRLGAHGSSWTQTLFRVGGATISDPSSGGGSLLVPPVDAWEQVDVTTGLMPIDVNAAGPAIILTPRRPSAAWTREISLVGGPAALAAGAADTQPPAVSRMNSWGHASLQLSGPLIPGRLGLFLTTAWTGSSRFDRGEATAAGSSLGSIFANLVLTPTTRDEFRLLGWANRAAYPLEKRVAFSQLEAATRDRGVHVQADWDRRLPSGTSWSGFASYTGRRHTPKLAAPRGIVIERLIDGPVAELLNVGEQSDRVWSLGAQVKPSGFVHMNRHHAWRAGGEIASAATSLRPALSGLVGETIDGVPARVWEFAPSGRSRWQSTSFALYASDTSEIRPRVTIDAGIRFESLSGSAAGQTGVSWRNWLPRAGLRWEMIPAFRVASFVNFGRHGERLPLRDLAYGDGKAPVGTVHRWTGTRLPEPGAAGAIVSRVGPGTGGDRLFSQIDPGVKRPYVDQITIGVESRPRPSALVRIAGLVRREKQLLGVENIGVPGSTYSAIFIPDAGIDHVHATDDQFVPVYNRSPSTFGADRYLLTNPAEDESTFVGVDATLHLSTRRLFLVAGGTAGRSQSVSANRGFAADENDQGVLGEVFVNPNARTFGRGRQFTERGYTIKSAGAYRFKKEVTLGIAARYQDGQHFARLIIVPNLNQGAEAVRAFANGRTRFTYTMTMDVRLQKGFKFGNHRFVALADAYNILNAAKEVEEFSVTGPMSRLTAAVQPPRAIHVGLRMGF